MRPVENGRMRVMLQNSETGLFYAGPSNWTSDVLHAVDFESVSHAVEAYKHERVAFAAIMVDHGPSLGRQPFAMPDEGRPSTALSGQRR